MDPNPTAPIVSPTPSSPTPPPAGTPPPPQPETIIPVTPGPSGHRLSLPMLIVTVVILLAVAGGFFAFRMYKSSKNKVQDQTNTEQTNTSVPTSPPVITPSASPDDLSGVDSKLSSLDDSLGNIDSGLNDKQTDLSQ